MQRKYLRVPAILLMVIMPWVVNAQFWGAKTAKPFTTPKDSLKKGEYTWAPDVSPSGPILVVVSLTEQMAYTYRNGVLIGVSTASTGKKGHETPTGVFHTILKDAKHRSSKYNNAPMPYTQKFTSSGIALHAGGLPGYPSSHGCVHLPSEYARLLYKETPMGMTVVVSKEARTPESLTHPAFLSPVTKDGKIQEHERLSATEKYRWTPEKADSGPVTLLISRADKRMIVLRNGVEIGRCKVGFRKETDSIGTYVYVAQNTLDQSGNSLKKYNWLAHSVTEHVYGMDHDVNHLDQLQRVQIPDEFLTVLTPIITDGTTMMITDAPVLKKTTGKEMSVLTSKQG